MAPLGPIGMIVPDYWLADFIRSSTIATLADASVSAGMCPVDFCSPMQFAA